MKLGNKFWLSSSILSLFACGIGAAEAVETEWLPRSVDDVVQDLVIDENNQVTYTVKSGDTLGVISEAMKIDVRYLAEINNISNIDLIMPETKLMAQMNSQQEAVSLSVVAPSGEKSEIALPVNISPIGGVDKGEEVVASSEVVEENISPVSTVAPVTVAAAPEAPVALPEETVAPEEPVALPEETVAPEEPVALPEETVAPEEPVALPEETVAPEEPVALPEETVAPEAPVALPEETVAPEAPVALPEETVAPEEPVALPEETVAPEAPVALPEETVAPVVPVEKPVTDAMSKPENQGLKPQTVAYKEKIENQFGVNTVSGYRPGDPQDHGQGLAVDFGVPVGSQLGDDIANYSVNNMAENNIKYVIWKQQINNGSGWTTMEDRGSITANHYDHVHVSFHK